MNPLLCCGPCKETFETRDALNNHVRKKHQLLVKAKFLNGAIKEIRRGPDGKFRCPCGRVFCHPVSLRTHASGCGGSDSPLNIGLNDGGSRSDNLMIGDMDIKIGGTSDDYISTAVKRID
jgi:hypothetical protein